MPQAESVSLSLSLQSPSLSVPLVSASFVGQGHFAKWNCSHTSTQTHTHLYQCVRVRGGIKKTPRLLQTTFCGLCTRSIWAQEAHAIAASYSVPHPVFLVCWSSRRQPVMILWIINAHTYAFMHTHTRTFTVCAEKEERKAKWKRITNVQVI